jgi:predicted dehydrogenase
MRIYLIGAGFIARSHADAIRKLPNPEEIEIKVADPNPKALQEFAELYPEAVTYTDTNAMLEEQSQEDDIVVVGTPPFLHYQLSKLALQTGRHALCEKPLVMSNQEAAELLALAKDNDRLLGCCSSRFVGLPKTEEIKRLLQSEFIGEVYKVSFIYRGQRSRPGVEYQPESRWFLDRSKSAGGVVMDWGPYDFAVLNDVFKPSSVEVLGSWVSKPETEADPTDVVYDVEGHVGAMMKYHLQDKSIIVHYERASCTHGKPYHLVEIEGTKGSIEWSPYFEGDKVICRYDKDGEVVTEEKEIVNDSNIGFMDHPLHFFYNKVKGNASQAITNEQAIFNFSCLQALYNGADTGVVQKVTKVQEATEHQNV